VDVLAQFPLLLVPVAQAREAQSMLLLARRQRPVLRAAVFRSPAVRVTPVGQSKCAVDLALTVLGRTSLSMLVPLRPLAMLVVP
jgi:hypothetical protein